MKNQWRKPIDNETQKKLLEILEPEIAGAGYMLLDLEYHGEGRGTILRLIVDRPHSGITIDECSSLSRQLGDLLDVEDIIPHKYNMEVGSPGVTRKLKHAHEFNFFKGRNIKLLIADNDKNYPIIGLLQGLEDNKVFLKTKEGIKTFALEEILKAQLKI